MKRPTDKMRMDWLENRGYPGQFIKYDRKDKPWFDFETIGSDYSQTLREAIDAAIGAEQAAPKPCCEPCPTGRCSPSAPCVCEVKPQATTGKECGKCGAGLECLRCHSLAGTLTVPPSKSEDEVRAEVWDAAAVEAEQERAVFLDVEGLAHWEDVARIRKQMRSEVAKACRDRAKALRAGKREEGA